MSRANADQFATLVSLIKEVKPGLIDSTINAGDSLVEHLGLDSLDILQLSRKVNRQIGAFDLESWNSGKQTVQSILNQINSAESLSQPPAM